MWDLPVCGFRFGDLASLVKSLSMVSFLCIAGVKDRSFTSYIYEMSEHFTMNTHYICKQKSQ